MQNVIFRKAWFEKTFPTNGRELEAMLQRNVDDQFRSFKICEGDGR